MAPALYRKIADVRQDREGSQALLVRMTSLLQDAGIPVTIHDHFGEAFWRVYVPHRRLAEAQRLWAERKRGV